MTLIMLNYVQLNQSRAMQYSDKLLSLTASGFLFQVLPVWNFNFECCLLVCFCEFYLVSLAPDVFPLHTQ